jgi:branched-chain amino acid transport system permease protein
MVTAEKSSSISEQYKLRRMIVGAAVVGILSLLPLIVRSSYTLHVLILTFVYIIATCSMRFIITSGQFTLGHAGFMGIGAYFSAVTSKWLGISPTLTIVAAAFVTMAAGMFIAYPFARLRTLYFSMVSLFFGTGLVSLIKALGKLTGGYQGLSDIPVLFNVASKVPYYYLFLAVSTVALVVLHKMEFSRFGTNLKAIDQSYLVAGSVGISEARHRILAMGFGCFFVGLAGAMYAHYNMALSPTSFDMGATLWLVMYVLIGGLTNFFGPIVGTVALLLIPELLRAGKQYTPFVSAGILFIVIFLVPNGLVSIPRLVRLHYTGRNSKRGGPIDS